MLSRGLIFGSQLSSPPPQINPIWSCQWYFKCIVEFGLLLFCWGFSHLYSSGILTCNFIFLCCPCLVWYLEHPGLMKWVWKCSLLFCFFGKNLRRIGMKSSFNVWSSSPVTRLVLDCCWEVLHYSFSILSGLFRSSVSSVFSLGRWCVFRNVSVSPPLSILLVCNCPH